MHVRDMISTHPDVPGSCSEALVRSARWRSSEDRIRPSRLPDEDFSRECRRGNAADPELAPCI